MKKTMQTLCSLLIVLAMLLPLAPAALAADGYTVAGDAGLCGVAWDPAQNVMTYHEETGLYEITFSQIAPGGYAFKVTDGTWDNNWGYNNEFNGGNYWLELARDESQSIAYDVTVFFDGEAKAITVSYTSYPVEAPTDPEPAFYTVAGDVGLCGVSWDPSQNAMTLNAETGLYEITFADVKPGSYGFKVTNGSWNQEWSDNGGNFTVKLDAVEGKNVAYDVTVSFDPVQGKASVAAQQKELGGEVTPPPQITYTVAGDVGLCGTAWDPTQNPMTLNEGGLHQITFPNVSAGEYKFKVTVGSWDQSWGDNGNDYFLKLEKNSDVTILFDAVTQAIAVDITEALPTSFTVKFHFLPEAKWGSEINAWLWSKENDSIPGYEAYHKKWPGKAIDANADHEGWYDLTVVTEDPAGFNFIFNDGKNQTSDLVTGKLSGDMELWYIGNGANGVECYTSAPEAWTGIPTYTYTLHYRNDGGWEAVNAYAWVDADQFLGSWPGTAISANQGNSGWYDVKFSVPYSALEIIFNNNAGSQTGNLAIAAPEDARKVEAWITGNGVAYTVPEGWAQTVSGNTVKIHFMPPYTSWGSNIHAWIWAGGSSVPGYEAYHQEWPGESVEADPEYPGWYCLEITTELSSFSFIFNGNGRQTKDLSTGIIDSDMEIWVYGNTVYDKAPATTPQTGDTANLALYLVMFSFSALALALVLGKKKLAR